MNLWFTLDNASFTEKFCVNKDKPEKSCHGSCMMKKINQAPRQKDDVTPFRINIQFTLSDYLPPQALAKVFRPGIDPEERSFCYFFKYLYLYAYQHYHPPQSNFSKYILNLNKFTGLETLLSGQEKYRLFKIST